jgi:hypothetical protein
MLLQSDGFDSLLGSRSWKEVFIESDCQHVEKQVVPQAGQPSIVCPNIPLLWCACLVSVICIHTESCSVISSRWDDTLDLTL